MRNQFGAELRGERCCRAGPDPADDAIGRDAEDLSDVHLGLVGVLGRGEDDHLIRLTRMSMSHLGLEVELRIVLVREPDKIFNSVLSRTRMNSTQLN